MYKNYSRVTCQRILLVVIVIIGAVYGQDLSVASNQDFVEPVAVVVDANSIPATQVPVNSQSASVNVDNSAQPQEVVNSVDATLHGIQPNVVVPIPEGIHARDPNQPKFDNSPQALAKAKQQAEKAQQMAEQARKQAEIDRKSRDMTEDEQLQKVKYDQTLTKTQRKKQQERLNFRKTARSVEAGTRFTEYLFEQSLGSSQFYLRIPANQQVAINLYTYVAQDNTYVRTKNIEQEEPVKIYIYENNQKVIAEGEFYYQHYIIFQGKANAMYLIRVVNNGRTKLISMSTKKLVEESHIADTLQKHDGRHVERTQNLAIDINKWFQEFRKIGMLDFQDLKAVEGFIQKYYSWQIFETILAVILSFFQVKMIGGMLQGNSIV